MSDSSVKKLKTAATTASVGVSTILFLLKAVGVVATGSLSVMSSMVDSLADILSSAISYIAVRFSNRRLSKNHRYGYGKAESVSALFQAAFIAGSGGFVLYDGLSRLVRPVEIEQTTFGIAIMAASLVLTVTLISFQKYVVKKTRSPAINADSAHYTVDLLTNTAIIISLLAVKYFGWYQIDILAAAVISVYLIYNAYHIALAALNEITDREIDTAIKEKIIAIITSTPEVRGYHDFRSRVSGLLMFVEFHLEMDGEYTLSRAHQISDSVEEKIRNIYPQMQVIIHQDPFGLRENRIDHEIDGSCAI